MASSWTDLLRALGQAFTVVVTSEAGALKQDLAASRRKLVVSLALGCLALFVLFWAVGAAGIALLEALSLVLPRWGSAGVVLLVLLCVGFLLGVMAKRRFTSIESPIDTVERRLANHLDWWQQNILGQDGSYPISELDDSEANAERRLEATDE